MRKVHAEEFVCQCCCSNFRANSREANGEDKTKISLYLSARETCSSIININNYRKYIQLPVFTISSTFAFKVCVQSGREREIA